MTISRVPETTDGLTTQVRGSNMNSIANESILLKARQYGINISDNDLRCTKKLEYEVFKHERLQEDARQMRMEANAYYYSSRGA